MARCIKSRQYRVTILLNFYKILPLFPIQNNCNTIEKHQNRTTKHQIALGLHWRAFWELCTRVKRRAAVGGPLCASATHRPKATQVCIDCFAIRAMRRAKLRGAAQAAKLSHSGACTFLRGFAKQITHTRAHSWCTHTSERESKDQPGARPQAERICTIFMRALDRHFQLGAPAPLSTWLI